jgi:hypothetical protein
MRVIENAVSVAIQRLLRLVSSVYESVRKIVDEDCREHESGAD